MIISNRLLRQISDPSLPKEKRAQLRCQLAKELEGVGNYEAAREAMGDLWSRVGEYPVLDGLEEATAAEVILRAGTLTGWIGSIKQIEGAQETSKNLIIESITKFETLQNAEKVAEGQMELGHCYWREGAYNEARTWLKEALDRLRDKDGEVKAITLLRLATVERAAKRFHEALQIHLDSAPFFQNIKNEALKGKFHYGFAFVLRNLATAEKRPDYIDRALIEYTAASYHFEQAKAHTRYQACVENNLGFLFGTIGKYREAHEHLDLAQALFTSMKDQVHTAQVDDTRARVLLAEGRTAEAERLVRSAVQILERGGEQSLLAEALTTHGIILARLGRRQDAHSTLRHAIEVAQNAGDTESSGLAALTILEELGDHLPADELTATYDRAVELLTHSGNQEYKDRLLEASRRVLFLIGAHPAPPTWKGFSFKDAVRRFEARIIERALREAGGVVARAAVLLGIKRQALDTMLKGKGRHTALARLRTPVEHRRSSLMFRDELDCPETRAVVILHVEDDATISEPISTVLHDEGWSVETVATGVAALEKLRGGDRLDVLIFDNKLPDTTGIELIKQMRTLAHRHQTPIIMFSGDEVETEARRAGANEFLRKPGEMSLLAETVARLLARRKGRES